MLVEFDTRHSPVHRPAVTHHVEVVSTEVDHATAVGVRDVCVADVPFERDRPIENLGAAGNLAYLERHVLAQDLQRLPDAVAGDASADRIEAPISSYICCPGSERSARQPARPSFDDCDRRNRDDEAAAASAVLGLLLENLVGEVPGEQ